VFVLVLGVDADVDPPLTTLDTKDATVIFGCSPKTILGPPSCQISTLAGTSILLISLSAPIRIVATLIRRITKVLCAGSEKVASACVKDEWKCMWKGIGGGSAPHGM
jgi:hypothetical protein